MRKIDFMKIYILNLTYRQCTKNRCLGGFVKVKANSALTKEIKAEEMNTAISINLLVTLWNVFPTWHTGTQQYPTGEWWGALQLWNLNQSEAFNQSGTLVEILHLLIFWSRLILRPGSRWGQLEPIPAVFGRRQVKINKNKIVKSKKKVNKT